MIAGIVLVTLATAITLLAGYGIYLCGEERGYRRGCKDSDKVYEDIIDELRGIKRDRT